MVAEAAASLEQQLDLALREAAEELRPGAWETRAAADAREAALQRACLLEHGALEPLFELLEARIEAAVDGDDPAQERDARWMLCGLRFRFGDLDEALEQVEALLEELPEEVNRAAWLERRAALLDALGKDESALEAWAELLAEVEDPALAAGAQLRLAMLKTDGEGDPEEADEVGMLQLVGAPGQPVTINLAGGAVLLSGAAGRDDIALDDSEQRADGEGEVEQRSSLAELAATAEAQVESQRRIGIVLGLLGRPGEALDVYPVPDAELEQAKALFRYRVRMAEWALGAERFERARSLAWDCVEAAPIARDLRYAHAVLVEAYRAEDLLDELIERLAAVEDPDELTRELWIDLLRESGRTDEALALFERGSEFTVEMRRELLEICRESGREDVLVQAYRDLIAAEPESFEWREGLARHFLERGDSASANELWRDYLGQAGIERYTFAAAQATRGLGLDDLAIECARRYESQPDGLFPALLFLVDLHLDRGRLDEAQTVLEELDEVAAPEAPGRMQLSEAFERIGDKRAAVRVLEGVREVRGTARGAEDLDLRLAWLYSELGEEQRAFDLYRELWGRIDSVSRRRFTEDRMMTVASRLGTLGDLAVELELRLIRGEATPRDAGLLVRLYTKVGDSVSATETIEEFLQQSGGDPLAALAEKARVYLECNDYYQYEQTVERLLELDPENRADYLRQLAMSQLERGRPDRARAVLGELRELEPGPDSAEFEAGVLALAGMREEALEAYRRGLARHPANIDSYLLQANVMRELGETERAVGMFQYLALEADKDDLFTIAIDGLLNMRADARVIDWARRVTLERLAARHDKMYLYQLLADLGEELEQPEFRMRALAGSLPIAAEQRTPILRELMDLAVQEGLDESRLQYGRRLLGSGDIVPPQVYLDLGAAFLEADEVRNAAKTFDLARDVADRDGFRLQVAERFKNARFLGAALDEYSSVLVSRTTDVGLMAEAAELHEQLGRDDLAHDLQARGIGILLARRPLSELGEVEAQDDDDRFSYFFRNRNVDAFDQHYKRLLNGFLTTLPVPAEGAATIEDAFLTRQGEQLERDLVELEAEGQERSERRIAQHPRVRDTAAFLRRCRRALEDASGVDELDLRLLEHFPDDAELLGRMVDERLDWGYFASARELLEAAPSPDELKAPLRFRAGVTGEAVPGRVPLEVAALRVLPLVAAGDAAALRELVTRTELGGTAPEGLQAGLAMLRTAEFVGDPELSLGLARQRITGLLGQEQDYSIPARIEGQLRRSRGLLDPERFQSLLEQVVEIALEDEERGPQLHPMLPKLRDWSSRPLIDSERAAELVEEFGGERYYMASGLFGLLDAEDLGATFRSVWNEVPKTQRASFALTFLSGFTSPLPPELESFLVPAFEAALDDADQLEFLSYYIEDLTDGDGPHADVVRQLVEVLLKREPSDLGFQAARVRCMQTAGQEPEALEATLELWPRLLPGLDENWQLQQAAQELPLAYLPEHLDEFLELLSAAIEDEGEGSQLEWRRWSMLKGHATPQRYLEEVRAAFERDPENAGARARYVNTLKGRGERGQARAVLEAALAAEPDDEDLRAQLSASWQAVQHPVEALAVLEAGDDEEAEAEAGAGAGVGAGMGEGDELPLEEESEADAVPDKLPAAEVQDLADEVRGDEFDAERARVLLRRLWRSYGGRDRNRGMSYMVVNGQLVPMNAAGDLTWPEAPPEGEAEGDEPEERPRGGLQDYLRSEAQAAELRQARLAGERASAAPEEESAGDETEDAEPERRSAWVALSDQPFARAELERKRRTLVPERIDSETELLDGLNAARLELRGVDGALAELIALAEDGSAGRMEHASLLDLWAEHPERVDAQAAKLLDGLLETLDPLKAPAVRRMARTFVRAGRDDVAEQLYLWCGRLGEVASPEPFFFFGGSMSLGDRSLLAEVREQLSGEARVRVVEALLAASEPDESGFGRDSHDRLVLDTWIDLEGPRAALERTRATVEGLLLAPDLIPRNSAAAAAELLAHAGEIEAATRALELAIARFETAGRELDPEMRYWIDDLFEPGRLDTRELYRLFPADHAEWADPGAWFEAAATAVTTWLDADRLEPRPNETLLYILALRLGETGRDTQALELLERLVATVAPSPSRQLWTIDLARGLGQEQRARGLERELLLRGALHAERIRPVASRLLFAGTALEGARVRALSTETLAPGLLQALYLDALRRGDTTERARWIDLMQRADAARAALEQRAEEGDE